MGRKAKSELLDETPPNDVELEKRVIGMMLVFPESVKTMRSQLVPSQFHDCRARWFYQAILEAGADVSLVVNWAREHGGMDKFRELDGPAYLAEAMYEHGLSTLAPYYIRILRDHATRRNVIKLATRMLQAAYSMEIPVEELLERCHKAVEWTRTRHGQMSFTPNNNEEKSSVDKLKRS